MDEIVNVRRRAGTGFGARELQYVGMEASLAESAKEALHRELFFKPEFGHTQIEHLSSTFLRSQEIAAFDNSDPITRSYDVLRNQLLKLRKGAGEQVIAVAAPTSGCGTTVTAVNLACSFARMRSGNVLIVDANMRSPGVGRSLGLPMPASSPEDGVRGELTEVTVDGVTFYVLRPGTAALVPSKADCEHLNHLIEEARQKLRPSTLLYDLPPILQADEGASLLSEADCIALVLAVGQSKRSELEVCRTFFGETQDVQVVLNRSALHGL